MKVAIMQPYFFPYLGYYQLLSLADVFVVFDCVQFPRSGWVHRNKFTMINGKVEWLTLPIIKGNRDSTHITDLRFSEKSSESMMIQFRRTRIFNDLKDNRELFELVFNHDDTVTSYLCSTLDYVKAKFGLNAQIIRSSSFSVPRDIKGQDRILFLLKELGGDTYINLSGGAKLYSKSEFEKNGMELRILNPYEGPKISMLERILCENHEELLQEIQHDQSA